MNGLRMKYFVLKPRSKTRFDAYAIASRCAMRTYAECIENENSELAQDLRNWINDEENRIDKIWK